MYRSAKLIDNTNATNHRDRSEFLRCDVWRPTQRANDTRKKQTNTARNLRHIRAVRSHQKKSMLRSDPARMETIAIAATIIIIIAVSGGSNGGGACAVNYMACARTFIRV